MRLCYETDAAGNLIFLSADGEKNYISSPAELEILKTGENPEGTVPSFGALTMELSDGAAGFSGTPDCVRKGRAFEYDGGWFVLRKTWRRFREGLDLEIRIRNDSERELTVRGLSVSLPYNNNYTRFMFDQDFLYRSRTCEHYYPCGSASYVLAEMLDGKQPVCWLLCGEGTEIRHFRKNPFSVQRENRGLPNHSYPGSLEAVLVGAGMPRAQGAEDEGGCRILKPGEEARFLLKWGFCADRAAFDALRVDAGQVVLRPVTGLVQPLGTAFVFEALSRSPVTFACPEGQPEQIGANRYRIRFDSVGEKELEASNENCMARMICYVTAPFETLIRARTKFILGRQVCRDPGDLLDQAILPFAEREFCGHTGLVREEGSLWGTGSYEGGICDACFAAEKNLLFPDPGEIAALEEYVSGYLLRYLQDPKTLRVNWFGYRALENRSYNYVHVANFYFSMYRIAERFGGTRRDKWEYLDLAARTLEVMFSVSRAMDLVVGNMGIGVVFEVLEAFARLGSIDRYFELDLKFRRYMEDVFSGIPYASECAYDNTGYEAVIRMCIARKDRQTALDLADIIAALKGNQPLWWWNGSDIRWWDAEFDFRECCHHYTSPYNGAALIRLMAETDWLKPREDLLSSAYGGLLGVLAKIRPDGFASMSYCPEPESEANFGFHRCTGDFGVGGTALLKNLTAFSLVEQEKRSDWLCEGEGPCTRFPKHMIRGYCRWEEGRKVTAKTDNGFWEEIVLERAGLKLSLDRPCGGRALVTIGLPGRLKGGAGLKLLEVGEGRYQIDWPEGRREVRLERFWPQENE